MRFIDNMTPDELDTLRLNGMVAEPGWDEKAERDRDLEHESRQAEANGLTSKPDSLEG